jgi:hypothetical protein
MGAIVALLGVDLAIPDPTTSSQRGGGLKVLSQWVEYAGDRPGGIDPSIMSATSRHCQTCLTRSRGPSAR